MATFDQIKEVRLAIKDPYNDPVFTNLTEVTSLPTTAVFQTAHKLSTDGVYYSTDKNGTVTDSDYSRKPTYVSDSTLTIWIDSKGVDYAKCQGLKSIISAIGGEMRVKAHGAGAERTEFTELNQLRDYYKALLEICDAEYNKSINNNSGSFGSMKVPEIAGDNL